MIHKFQKFVKLLQMVHQLIRNFQKLSSLRRYNQEDFLYTILLIQLSCLIKLLMKSMNYLTKVSLTDIIKTANTSKLFIGDLKNVFGDYSGAEITLTNNEIKYIIKVIKPLENRVLLLKGTTRKMTIQEGGF